MKIKSSFILFVLLAILFSLTACGSTAPKVSNFYMATDDQGANKTSTFAPTDGFYLFFDVSHISNGTSFEARWYVLNVAGKDPNTPFQIEDLTYNAGQTTLRFHLTNITNWPVGQYRVDVYMSGNQVGQVLFSVSQ
jgi:predicted small lipoprotein YifL